MSHDHTHDESDTDRRIAIRKIGVGKSHQLARHLADGMETAEFVDPKSEDEAP